MATSAPNLSSTFSLLNRSSNVSATSFTFQIPNKISCLSSKKPTFLGFSNLGITAATSHLSNSPVRDAVPLMKNPGGGRDLIVAQAAETAAPTTEEGATSQSKPSKKSKKIKYPRRVLDVYQILQAPIITEAAIKNIADENSLIFTVDVRADKKMIRDAFTNFFGVKVRKINTLVRPDGTKKAYIMLNRDFNASDLAKKIGLFPSSS